MNVVGDGESQEKARKVWGGGAAAFSTSAPKLVIRPG